jgi:hypothetical protein
MRAGTLSPLPSKTGGGSFQGQVPMQVPSLDGELWFPRFPTLLLAICCLLRLRTKSPAKRDQFDLEKWQHRVADGSKWLQQYVWIAANAAKVGVAKAQLEDNNAVI